RDLVVSTEVYDRSTGARLRLGRDKHEVVARGVLLHDPVVAQDRLRSRTGGDRVRSHSSEYVPVAITQGDEIVAACGCQDVRRFKVHRQPCADQTDPDVRHLAVVPDHQVIAAARRDRVRSVTTQDALVPVAGRDLVVTTQVNN